MTRKPTASFDLAALVRDVCDHGIDADPAIIAKHVNHRIGRNDRDAALEQALVAYVRAVVTRSRLSMVVPQITPGGHPLPEAQSAPATGGHRSTSIREAWRKVLRNRIPVGPEPGEWRFLVDCTASHLDYAAAVREELARRNENCARQYRALGAALIEHGVTTVGELPDDVLYSTLTGAA